MLLQNILIFGENSFAILPKKFWFWEKQCFVKLFYFQYILVWGIWLGSGLGSRSWLFVFVFRLKRSCCSWRTKGKRWLTSGRIDGSGCVSVRSVSFLCYCPVWNPRSEVRGPSSEVPGQTDKLSCQWSLICGEVRCGCRLQQGLVVLTKLTELPPNQETLQEA